MLHVPRKYLFHGKVRNRSYRYCHLPNKETTLQIVVVNGHHSNIERIFPLLKYLQRFGSVYCPDLPGFGKSEPFRRRRPSLILEAEFLHYFCHRHLPVSPTVIIGTSMGFMITTLFLQQHIHYQEQVRGVVSIAGFLDAQSLRFSSRRLAFFRGVTKALSRKWLAGRVQRFVFTQGWLMRWIVEQNLIKKDYRDYPIEKKILAREFDVQLWRENDLYTHFATLDDILHLSITGKKISVPLFVVHSPEDKYIKTEHLKPSIKKIYPSSTVVPYNLQGHAPVYISSMQEFQKLIPEQIVDFLTQVSAEAKSNERSA